MLAVRRYVENMNEWMHISVPFIFVSANSSSCNKLAAEDTKSVMLTGGPDEISSNILRINSNLRHQISDYFIGFLDIVLISNDLN